MFITSKLHLNVKRSIIFSTAHFINLKPKCFISETSFIGETSFISETSIYISETSFFYKV